MLAQIFEFLTNHYLLSGTFLVLLIAFLVNEGKRGGASISTATLVTLINREGAAILDVRDAKEFGVGHIANAINIPFSSFDDRATELEKFKEKPLVVVCKMGQHSGAVGRKLLGLGFSDVRRLGGGMGEWHAANLPVVK